MSAAPHDQSGTLDPEGKGTSRPTPGDERRSRFPIVGLLIGAWSVLPPYVHVFGKLDVTARVEFADHVVPGIAVLAAAIVGIVVLRAANPSELPLFLGGAVVTLAGFWMAATHLPLVKQGRTGQVDWGPVVWHSLPGVVVTLLGVAWTIRFWGSDESDEASGP